MAEGTSNKIYFARGTNPSLPLELFIEILSWLPALSLMVCKCVCRSWKSIIEEPSFIDMHMKRAKPMILFRENEEMDARGEKFNIVVSSRGLVLQVTDKNVYRIKNPATRQVLRLPDPVKEFGYMHLSYVSGSMVYKLIHLHRRGRESTYLDCKVLTVADDGAWRDLNIPSLENIYGDNAMVYFGANSGIFYIIKIGNHGLADNKIIWLDLTTECFSCAEIPSKLFCFWKNVYPMMWRKNLSLTTVVGDKLIIQVLENYEINQWADREIIIPITSAKYLFEDEHNVRALLLSGNKLFINVNDHKYIFYNIEENKVEHILSVQEAQNLPLKVQPCLVQLKGMQPEERYEG